MGESGQVVLSAGVGAVKPLFTDRAHKFRKSDEISMPYIYQVTMDAASVEAGLNLTESIYSPVPGGSQPVPAIVSEGANGRTRRDAIPAEPTQVPRRSVQETEQDSTIHADMTATSHVGLLQLDFRDISEAPYVFVQATRQNWTGDITIDPSNQEIHGSNPQRQDYNLGPLHAPGFKGYFVSRFSQPFSSYGVTHGGRCEHGSLSGSGEHLGAFVTFEKGCQTIEVRTGVSFVSVEQARRNLELETPADVMFADIVESLKVAWLEKIGRVTIEGYNETDAAHDPRTIFYTSLFHALQYPSDFSEPLSNSSHGSRTFYSGYTDSAHEENDSYYQSWSIWDTFRAEHSILTMFAPERVNSMMRSLVRIFEWSGRLPMWANVVETNIMIGTHVDAVIANALERGFKQFDIEQAWEGVRKNAYEPPLRDTELLYFDREAHTPDEARAGLTGYNLHGYVPNDQWVGRR
jgi:putative alpha-1,2-mannosidase